MAFNPYGFGTPPFFPQQGYPQQNSAGMPGPVQPTAPGQMGTPPTFPGQQQGFGSRLGAMFQNPGFLQALSEITAAQIGKNGGYAGLAIGKQAETQRSEAMKRQELQQAQNQREIENRQNQERIGIERSRVEQEKALKRQAVVEKIADGVIRYGVDPDAMAGAFGETLTPEEKKGVSRLADFQKSQQVPVQTQTGALGFPKVQQGTIGQTVQPAAQIQTPMGPMSNVQRNVTSQMPTLPPVEMAPNYEQARLRSDNIGDRAAAASQRERSDAMSRVQVAVNSGNIPSDADLVAAGYSSRLEAKDQSGGATDAKYAQNAQRLDELNAKAKRTKLTQPESTELHSLNVWNNAVKGLRTANATIYTTASGLNDEAIQGMADSVRHFDTAPSQIPSGPRGNVKAQVTARILTDDPTFDMQKAEATYAFKKNNQTMRQVTAISSMEKELTYLEGLSNKLDRLPAPLLNKPLLVALREGGLSDDSVQFQNAVKEVAFQLPIALSGSLQSAGSDQRMGMAMSMLDPSLTVSQFRAAIKAARDLSKIRKGNLVEGPYSQGNTQATDTTVTAGGKTYSFSSTEVAAAFKKAAGIQ